MLNWIKPIRIMLSGVSNIRCKIMKGIVFDIKEFSIHDGPGGRITVFLKGCPLHCLWCHNPEGLKREPQLLYKDNLCSHCGKCMVPCRHEECKPFGRCIHACANGCLDVAGEVVSSTALAEKLLENKDILEIMGGGITISGGEPLLQSDFVCELADKLEGIHLAIQTSGYAEEDVYRRVISRFDYVMQDIKLADTKAYMQYTGVYNDQILKNIEHLKDSGKEFIFRVPLIPGITDTEENLAQIAEIAGEYPVELLYYNSLAGAKYAMLGMEYQLSIERNRLEDFTKYFKNARMG